MPRTVGSTEAWVVQWSTVGCVRAVRGFESGVWIFFRGRVSY